MSVLNNPLARAVLWVALLCALAVVGDWLLTTHFMVYDDEGYVLWSLRNYIAEGGLYTRVYSQYGPFFYVAYDAWHRITGWALTNDNARWITLVCWIASAGLAGAIAAELTRSAFARAMAALMTFAALSVMSSEPGHPGGPIALLSALGAWWGVRSLVREQAHRFVAGAALVGSALLMMKINVGVFFFIAAASWIALHTRGLPGRVVAWAVALGCVASPLLLMRDRLDVPGFAQFGLVFAAGAVALLLAAHRTSRNADFSFNAWARFAGLAIAFAGAICAIVVLRGTTWADLLNGVAIAPLNQPLAYSFPPRWHPLASAVAFASLVGAAIALSRAERSEGMKRAIAGARLAALAALVWWSRNAVEHTTGTFFFHFGVSLAWLFALPLHRAEGPIASARIWLGWVFVWQTLHAFPVAGSQIGWGSLLAGPLFAIGTWEAIEELFLTRPRLARTGHVFALALAVAPTASLAQSGWFYRQHSTPLGLQGANRVRMPLHLALTARTLVRNVQLHGKTLFSHPGMFSFNLWSGHPTPTPANVTLWSTLLSNDQQEAIRVQLESDERAVIIGQEYVLNHLILQGFAPRGALNDYLIRNFRPAFRVDTYVLWVKRGREIAAVATAARTGRNELELITDRATPPRRWEIWSYGHPQALFTGEMPAATTTELINPSGAPAAGNEGLRRVRWSIPDLPLPRAEDMALRVLDAEGREIEFVPFRS